MAEDPVLLQIHQDLKDLKTASYETAMASGHRYLEEGRLSARTRDERLDKARDQLVHAASAAEVLDVPLLIANAEFAIAKCDVLLAEPEHAELALRKASTALESAIAKVDMSNAVWSQLTNAKFQQDESMGKWFERLTSGMGLVKKTDIAAAEAVLQERMKGLVVLTDLYSEVQTAVLAAAGSDTPVVWTQPTYRSVTDDIRDNAVAPAPTGVQVSGFGLLLRVERQVVWRPEGELVVDLLLWIKAIDDRALYCRAEIGIGTPNTETENAAAERDVGHSNWLVPAGKELFTVAKGTYRGWLRVPAAGSSLDFVNIRPSAITGPYGYRPTRASVQIPITGSLGASGAHRRWGPRI